MVKSSAKKDPILSEFARKVRVRRYDLGLTQEELAERADFHVNYIGGIEEKNRLRIWSVFFGAIFTIVFLTLSMRVST